ncbi:MAG: DNA repair protein RecO [Syntrophorhabdaceae bacterium]|nr:DNA repair protein RecO [Syntrophorhabdaceae bacterium]
MALQKDEAIVLIKKAYGESDRIVRLFTLSGGKITAIAKGGGKSQRRFMNTLEPFNHIRVEYFKKQTKTMARIENADIIESNSGIDASIKRICTASFFVEFTDKLTKEGEKNIELFKGLNSILNDVKKIEFTSSDIVFHLLRILGCLGFMPNFNTCVHCGKDVPDDEKVFFSRERGGILCPLCSGAQPFKSYPSGIIKGLSSFVRGDRCSGDFDFLTHVQDIMEGFISFHLDVEIKSYRLLKTLI